MFEGRSGGGPAFQGRQVRASQAALPVEASEWSMAQAWRLGPAHTKLIAIANASDAAGMAEDPPSHVRGGPPEANYRREHFGGPETRVRSGRWPGLESVLPAFGSCAAGPELHGEHGL